MSSDSDDDCYGNIAQRLQSMKNKYSEDKIDTTNLLLADLKEKNDNSWRKNDSITSDKDCDLSQNSQQNSEASEEYSLDAIIAKNSKKRVTRANKRAADVCANNIPAEKVARNKRTKKNGGNTSQSAGTCDVNENRTNAVADTSANSTSNSVPQTAPALNNSVPETASALNNSVPETASALNDSVPETASTRGRGRGRRTRTGSTPNRSGSNNTPRARGRTRRRRGQGRGGYWAQNEFEPAMYDLMAAIAASQVLANYSNGTVYSVGNTDEYPDQCDDQPLFNNQAPKSDVIVIEENEADLENEELSVKVYWQSSEHIKFNIRRFQKLTKIFEHFAEREHVSQDKLFFTYNDKILKSDDTPDSISYSIVKFIDGGIINQSVSSIVKNDGKEKGIKLKFQCQNIKKPFVMYIQPEDTMSVVMMKCAEHLEKPLVKLKFYFDGDLISGKDTAKQLELEGGECIDVKIIS